MRTINHFGIGDIENVLGLSSTAATVQNTQKALDNLNPQIQFIDKNLGWILLGWFVATIFACFIALKLSR